MTSVLVPFLYIFALVGSLYVFSKFYRKRAAERLQKDPWWPSHPERDVYIALLQQTDPPTPDYLLKAALLRRAVADVARIHSIREDKQAATVLVQKGSIGDDVLSRLQAAEKELEAEILEIVAEANSFKEGWGSFIFQTASEILANEKTRQLCGAMAQRKEELSAKYNKQNKTQVVVPSTQSRSTAGPSGQVDTLKVDGSVASHSAASSEAEDSSQRGGSRSKKTKKRK